MSKGACRGKVDDPAHIGGTRGLIHGEGALGIGCEGGPREFDRHPGVVLGRRVNDPLHAVLADGVGEARNIEQLALHDAQTTTWVNRKIAVVADDLAAVGKELVDEVAPYEAAAAGNEL